MRMRNALFTLSIAGITMFLLETSEAGAQPADAAANPDGGGPPLPPSAAAAETEPADAPPVAGPPPEPAPPAPAAAPISVPPPEPEPAARPHELPADSESMLAADSTPAEFGATAVTIAPGSRAGIALDDVPRNVQVLSAADIASQHVQGLHSALAARFSSATINDVQNNPLQPDFQYRGFTLSPLLGVPQGLAVYQNGVRINEPFGDLLQWDLIPTFALASAQLIPGANPVYGLNALGGSLVLRMKDGFSAPGARVEASGGSFARYRTTLEYGQSFGDWAVYAGASLFDERGFRNHSRSNARNLFTDLRHRTTDFEVGASLTLAGTELVGNGPAPIELLREDRSAIFTWPDITDNELWMVSFDARKVLSRRASLLGTAYLRHGSRDTVNGDAGEFEICPAEDGESVICDEEGEVLLDEAARTIAAAEPFDAVFNTTRTVSDSHGASLQLDFREPLAERPNRLVAGVSYDGAYSEFLQRAEAGFLTPDRTVQGTGVYFGNDAFRTDLHVRDHNLGAYVSDTWNVIDPVALTLAARANWFEVTMDDRGGTSLDGQHQFARINPSIGATFRLIDGLTLFASYGESSRAPSASELACADPDEPCRVPNAFIADPPLEQVVSRSVEAGVRGRLGDRRRPWLRGSLAAFGSRNQDDILFIAGSRIGTGYFQNAGDTQRIGLELALELETGPVRFYAGYTLMRATFEDELELPGGAHPSLGGDDDVAGEEEEEDATLDVDPGSRIPGLPTHAIKAGLAIRPMPALEVGVSMVGQSSQPFRGDEANLIDGAGGFVVLGAHASYQLLSSLQLFVHANNLLDTEYHTFGVLGEPDEALPGTSNPRFYGIGAPFGVWAGATFTHD